MKKNLLGGLGVLAIAAFALTGCSTTLTVNKDTVAETISSTLAPQLGYEAEVTCPEDLTGELGATLRCELVDDQGEAHFVDVTVTSVEGTNVNFDIEVPSMSAG